MNPKLILKNKTALKTLIILVISFSLILFMALFIYSLYFTQARTLFDNRKMRLEFVKTALIAQALPPQFLKKNFWLLERDNIRISISDKAPQNSFVISANANPKALTQFTETEHWVASIRLEKAEWLIIRTHHVRRSWFFMFGIGLSILLLFAGVIVICSWVVQRLSVPTAKFIEAAKRFGMDIQSSPMALSGPPEIQEVMQAFNEMQLRLRKIVQDRTQMLAAISHDLRTPITRLQLRAEFLKDHSQYQKILDDLNDMEKMISSILSFAQDYARTEAMTRFDINGLLQSLSDDIKDSGGKINYSAPENRVAFYGRFIAMKRALNNLLENAIKYGVEVDVELSTQDEKIHIKIMDIGPGIPQEEMEQVFAPFYRVDRARSPEQSGSGLGLTVARDIIRAHGGDISLSNRDPHGLSVHVILPINQ
jgi:signal transduction histidine kinase